jgi:methionyl-tRNA formyltransferase
LHKVKLYYNSKIISIQYNKGSSLGKRIIFMGTPDYATIILNRLLKAEYNIVALYTQPDKPVGRKQLLTPPHIKQYCLEDKCLFPIHQPNSLKDEEVVNEIKSYMPDIIIVAAYGQILPKAVLDIAPCINLHASLLPKYRGASPIQQALLNDDEYAGVTSMLMDVGLDSGDILGLKYFKIPKDMVVSELFDALSRVAAELTIETLENFETIKAKQQNLSLVSHCGKVKKTDGLVDFVDAKKFYNKYRAYKSWPDIYLSSGLKIKECELLENDSVNEAGKILEITKEYVHIGCIQGSIKIFAVQPQSKKQMKATDYLRGARIEVGDIFS